MIFIGMGRKFKAAVARGVSQRPSVGFFRSGTGVALTLHGYTRAASPIVKNQKGRDRVERIRMQLCSVLSVATLLLAACAPTAAGLVKPDHESVIVVEQDYTRSRVGGAFKYKFVEGLKAGTYRAIGSDSKGTYYAAEGRPVIWMHEPASLDFEKTHVLPPDTADRSKPGNWNYYEGGIFLPKDPAKEKVQLFYVIKVVTGDLGPGTAAIARLFYENSFVFIPFDSESDFVARLQPKS